MEALFENLSGCDVEIVVRGYKFSAHKAILSARSPVFRAMFELSMKEKVLNRVDIDDIDKEVFAKVLTFIYTDKVSDEGIDSNMKILMAADKVTIHSFNSLIY